MFCLSCEPDRYAIYQTYGTTSQGVARNQLFSPLKKLLKSGMEPDGISVPLELMALGATVFLAHLFQFVFQRFRVPDTLWLIGVGLLIGPFAGWVTPEDFGIVGPVLTAIALAVILFEAGLELRLSDLKSALGSAVILTAVVYVFTLVAVMLVVKSLTSFSWISSLFIGAVLATPAPPVILPMLSQSVLPKDLKVTMTLESALGEALGLVIALGILRVAGSDDLNVGEILAGVFNSFVVAGLIGLAAGVGWAYLLTRVRGLKHSMVLTPSMVFLVFGLTDYLEFSGPVAVLAFGLVLGNLRSVAKRVRWLDPESAPARIDAAESDFIGELVFLLKTFFFVFLGLNMRPGDLFSVAAFAIVGVLLLVRFLSVRLAIGHRIDRNIDGCIVGSLIPKGLAAAVMAAAATESALPKGGEVDNLIYAVILFSIVVTAILVFVFERTPAHGLFARWWQRNAKG